MFRILAGLKQPHRATDILSLGGLISDIQALYSVPLPHTGNLISRHRE